MRRSHGGSHIAESLQKPSTPSALRRPLPTLWLDALAQAGLFQKCLGPLDAEPQASSSSPRSWPWMAGAWLWYSSHLGAFSAGTDIQKPQEAGARHHSNSTVTIHFRNCSCNYSSRNRLRNWMTLQDAIQILHLHCIRTTDVRAILNLIRSVTCPVLQYVITVLSNSGSECNGLLRDLTCSWNLSGSDKERSGKPGCVCSRKLDVWSSLHAI